MKLYTALRNIIGQFGEQILFDARIINMLTDYNAFDDYPATKNILREIIDSKYSQQLINCKQWNIQSEKILSDFITKTGFQRGLSIYVFQSIAFSLGWIGKVDTPVEPQFENKKTSTIKFSNMALYKQRAYIRNLVNINIDFESYGVTAFWFLDNSSGGSDWRYKNSNYIRVVLAIEGHLNRDIHIKYSTYDVNGNLKHNDDLGKFEKSKFHGVLELDKQIFLGTFISRISKIEIFDISNIL